VASKRGVVCATQLGGGGPGKDELKVEVDVKDSGMMIVTTVAPEMQWIGGAAHLQLTCAQHLLTNFESHPLFRIIWACPL
jgi:hypothetical protein